MKLNLEVTIKNENTKNQQKFLQINNRKQTPKRYFNYFRSKFKMDEADFNRDKVIYLRVVSKVAPPGTLQVHLLDGEGHHITRGKIDEHLPKTKVRGSMMFKDWFYKLVFFVPEMCEWKLFLKFEIFLSKYFVEVLN